MGNLGSAIQVLDRRTHGDDFTVAFQPENCVIFRHHSAVPLRHVCRKLRWKIIEDIDENPDAQLNGSQSRGGSEMLTMPAGIA